MAESAVKAAASQLGKVLVEEGKYRLATMFKINEDSIVLYKDSSTGYNYQYKDSSNTISQIRVTSPVSNPLNFMKSKLVLLVSHEFPFLDREYEFVEVIGSKRLADPYIVHCNFIAWPKTESGVEHRVFFGK